jgi:signal transduction histidine kinase
VGRLFWKFFLSILLAQVAATVGIGGALWLRDSARSAQQSPDIDTSPPAQLFIEAAAATLQYGGPEGLRAMLVSNDHHRTYVVDEKGRDLLGRKVDIATLGEARALLARGDKRHSVRKVSAGDGHDYLLFLPASIHLLGIGPGPGPGPDGPPRGEAGPPPDVTAVAAGAASMPPMPAEPHDFRPFHGLGGGHGEPLDPRLRPVILLVAATAASLLFAFLLAWHFSRPIRALRLAFEAASRGDLAPRFSDAGGKRGDDLNDLGRDFDRMTGRLRNLMDGQTRLLHDVSHELRSPLARLQAAIGLAHQQPERLQASMERVERESVRMDKLVGELLTLSRLEAGALDAAGVDISVADLIEEIIGDASFEASASNRMVTVDGDADVVVEGRPDLLGRAIENVVRNAIKHSPDGGTVGIELGIAGEGRSLRIRVLDRGPGVAPSDLQAIFQPFYRGSNTEKDTDGHGLGLAIARHVVQAHGGAIAARNRDGGGLEVEIMLPVKR